MNNLQFNLKWIVFINISLLIMSWQELWSRDNIMQSWPDRMPTWIKQVKAQVKVQPPFAAGPSSRGADTSLVSRRSSRSARTLFSGSKVSFWFYLKSAKKKLILDFFL